MMDDREFWRLIDESREAAGGNLDQHSRELRKLLAGRSREDLEAFAIHFETFEWDAYTWDCWAAGYLLAGGMRDDAFEEFRYWLISRGERVYRLAITDPDALADELPPDEDTFAIDGLW